MGNFTFSEIFTIVVVILIVFGPNRLPELARKAGALASKARSAMDSLKSELDAEYGEVIAPLREARNEIRSAGAEIKGQISTFGDEVAGAGKEIKAITEKTLDPNSKTAPEPPAAESDVANPIEGKAAAEMVETGPEAPAADGPEADGPEAESG